MSISIGNVAVLIVNWNCSPDTISTAARLAEWGFFVVVVDNGSDISGEVASLERALPRSCALVKRSSNGGFGAGMNDGMREALKRNLEFAILLNPDVDAQLDVFRSMLLVVDDDVDVVGIAQATELSAGESARYQSAALLDRAKVLPLPAADSRRGVHEVDVVSGACMLVRLSSASAVNFIDESFFHYKEEFDFVYRIKQLGRKVVYVDEFVLLHRNGSSLSTVSAQARYYHFRNEILFVRKNFGLLELIRTPAIFKGALFEVFKRRRMKLTASILLGVGHGLLGRSGRYKV